MRRLFTLFMVVAVIVAGGIGYVAGTRHSLAPAYVMASAECATFPQTGKTVCGRFLEYWQKNGALAQQGLPLSDEFKEVSSVNQQTYTVQYFERAVFEMHPENLPPYDVLLTLLGREKFLAKYPGGNTSAPPSPTPPPSAAPSSAPPAPALPRTASTSQVALTVHEVRDPSPANQYVSPDPGNRFVAIDVTLKNVGTKVFSSNELYFRVRGSDGREYTDQLFVAPNPDLKLINLQPNQDTRGWVGFELPSGVKAVRVTFDHILLDGPVAVDLP